MPDSPDFFNPHEKTYWHSLLMNVSSFSGLDRFTVSLATLLSLILFIGIAYAISRFPASPTAPNPSVLGTSQTEGLSTQPSPTKPAPSPTPGIATPQIVNITLSLKSTDHLPPQTITDTLLEVLNIASTSAAQTVRQIGFDTLVSHPYTQNPADSFNQSYLVALDSLYTPPSATFENDFLTAQIIQAPPELFPFLANPKFCQSNQDCQIRVNYCTLGAYNQYQPVLNNFACMGTFDETGASTQGYVEEYDCQAAASYSATLCLGNLCQARDRFIKCQE